MQTLRFYLLLCFLLLLSAQCQKPEEPDIKPKPRITHKWACMGFTSNIRPYNPGNRLELWLDNTYKVYSDSMLKGEGIYQLYTKKRYDYNGNPFLVPIISMTGYDIEYWVFGFDVYTYKSEYAYARFIGDSLCRPAIPLWASDVPEALQDIIAYYNLSDEVLMLNYQMSTAPHFIFLKL